MKIFMAEIFRKKTEKPSKSGNENTSVFRGDLAMLREPQNKTVSQAYSVPVRQTVYPDSDSKDSVVFLSFDMRQKTGWVCQECGTRNSENYIGCVICGLPK